ncbi:hypothetical protein LTR95_010771 [Oleoguttula sp. CCFEE 5521]
MELVVTDPNDEAEDEEFWEREIVLTQVLDVSGFHLLEDGPICILEDALLRNVHEENRCVDTKRGGGYLGNSHAEIDQVYKDSFNHLSEISDRGLSTRRYGWQEKGERLETTSRKTQSTRQDLERTIDVGRNAAADW